MGTYWVSLGSQEKAGLLDLRDSEGTMGTKAGRPRGLVIYQAECSDSMGK